MNAKWLTSRITYISKKTKTYHVTQLYWTSKSYFTSAVLCLIIHCFLLLRIFQQALTPEKWDLPRPLTLPAQGLQVPRNGPFRRVPRGRHCVCLSSAVLKTADKFFLGNCFRSHNIFLLITSAVVNSWPLRVGLMFWKTPKIIWSYVSWIKEKNKKKK